MRGIIGRQCNLYLQYALRQFNVQIVNHTRGCNVWIQQSLQFSTLNRLQSCQTKSLKLSQPMFPLGLRNKSKRSIPSKEESEYDSDDSDDSSVILEKGADFKDMRCKVASLRIGSFAKVGFNISRTLAEKEFYANKFRVNGKKPDKKSANLAIGDVLDYIKQNSVPESPDLVEVSRVELIDIGGFADGSTNLTVVIRRFPRLLLLREDVE